MKFRFFIVAAAIIGFAACKSPYKATDQSRSSTDTTASATDTSANMDNNRPSTDTSMNRPSTDTSMNTMPSTDTSMNQPSTDTSMNRPSTDTMRMDPTTREFPDSSRMDSTNRADQDSSMMDSTRSDTSSTRSQTDTSNTNPSVDANATQSQTPAAVEPVFSKQYPTAANAVWTNYDSLANVPIDMRLSGWGQKLDAEDHMVKFDFEDNTYYAWYDSNGKWIGSAYTLNDISKLPAKVKTAVQNAIKSRYTDYEISQVNRELQPGKNVYEVALTKGESEVRMLVTPAGKITQIFKYTKQK